MRHAVLVVFGICTVPPVAMASSIFSCFYKFLKSSRSGLNPLVVIF